MSRVKGARVWAYTVAMAETYRQEEVMSLPQMAVAYQGPRRSFLPSPVRSSSGVGEGRPGGGGQSVPRLTLRHSLINFLFFVHVLGRRDQPRSHIST